MASQRGTVIRIFLTESSTILDEINIVDDEQAIVGSETVNRLNTSFIKKAPALLGEKDVLKTIQLLPGVQFGTEGSNALHVREVEIGAIVEKDFRADHTRALIPNRSY